MLAGAEGRLITILGPGGMGKTRLAIETAAELIDNFRHGAVFIALTSLAASERLVSAIASAIGYTFQTNGQPERQQLLDFLRPRETLLVLDNIEHLLAGTSLLTDILQTAPQVRMLVTSRERLQLISETVFVLDGLPTADVTGGQGSAAVDLFVQTARQIRSTFDLTVDTLPDVQQICRLVQGMPLALILAASWIEVLTPAEIAIEISRSIDFLAADMRDLPARQRSVRAIFETSWQRLPTKQRELFMWLSIFRGGFTREAAVEVGGASLALLKALGHRSLIRHDSTGRYEIHELLRQFGLELLAEQAAEAHARHAEYFCGYIEQREIDLRGSGQSRAMAEIEVEIDNIRSAWQWAVSHEKYERSSRALEALALFHLWRGLLREGESLCRFAIDRVSTILAPVDRSLHQRSVPEETFYLGINAYIWLSVFQRHMKQIEAAQRSLDQANYLLAAPSLVGLDLRAWQSRLVLEQAELSFLNDKHAASKFARESHAMFRSLGDSWHMAQALDLLGHALRIRGVLDEASQATGEGLTLRRELGDTRGVAISLRGMATIARFQGRIQDAVEQMRQSNSIFEDLEDWWQHAFGLTQLAGIMVHGGQYIESLRLFDQAVAVYRKLGLPGEPGQTTLVSAVALIELGRYDEAETLNEQGLSLYAEVTPETVRLNIGRVALAKGDYQKAREDLTSALASLHKAEIMQTTGSCFGYLGMAALGLREFEEAQQAIRKALEIAAGTQLYLPSLIALLAAALESCMLGKIDASIEFYALALKHKHVANSQWHEDVVGRHIEAAAKTVSPEMVEAARARGRNRELHMTILELLERYEA